MDLRQLFPRRDSTGSREIRRERLEELRARHSGSRGVIVGNGPSLNSSVLDRIVGEISIASNSIHLAFSDTPWRPVAISVTDKLVWEKVQSARKPEDLPYFVDDSLLESPVPNNVVPVHRVARLQHEYISMRSHGKPFSTNLEEGYFGGYTVSYFNLQLAWSIGLNPVYLVGFDHRFTDNKVLLPRRVRLGSRPSDHFNMGYRRPLEVVNGAPVRLMNAFFRSAAEFARRDGWDIYDLTPGGNLPFFRKKDFEEVF